MSTRTPQVGDLLVLDGRTRRITEVTGNGVSFGHPEPDVEAARRVAMRAWKDGGRAGDAPEGSRDGFIGARWLVWMDGLNCFFVEGRVEAKTVNPNAVQLEPAVAEAITNGE